MAYRGQKKPRAPVGDLGDPQGMAALLEAFLEYLQLHNFSERTVRNHDANLRRFIIWCSERALTKAADVTKPAIDRYQRFLYHYRTAKERPLSFATQQVSLCSLQVFFRWLVKRITFSTTLRPTSNCRAWGSVFRERY